MSTYEKVVTESTCPACLRSDLRPSRPSKRSGNVILRCRHCGLQFLRERWGVEELTEAYDVDREWSEKWVGATREATIESSHNDVLERLQTMVPADSDRSLFDVGAGDGGFLSQARDASFVPAGNGLSSGAVELAHDKYGIDLHLGDLSTLEDDKRYDAVTLWCVLAHVPESDPLMTGVHNILSPRGVMYLQTPRWSSMDLIGKVMWTLSRGRSTRILDRRLAIHHMFLRTERSMRALLGRLDFEILAIEAKARYSVVTRGYLGSLGIPARLGRILAGPIDFLIDRNLFFRNVLDVYATRKA